MAKRNIDAVIPGLYFGNRSRSGLAFEVELLNSWKQLPVRPGLKIHAGEVQQQESAENR